VKRDQVITRLKQHEPEFRDAGVGALFLFGSVARDQTHDASDIDVFFDLARPQGFTLFDLVALQERMQEILGAKVDLMTRQGIHPRRRPRMPDAAPIDSLPDILELIERIERQTGKLTREVFLKDADVQDATAYRLLAMKE
jgi:uncharacterized protein